METSRVVRWGVAAALMVAPCAAAHADKLKVVEVAAPAINCVFSPLCSILPTDSTAPIPLNLTAGTAFLQTRTFFGIAGTPGGGRTAYEYRVDLRSADGDVNCLLGLVVNFGPIVNLPYRPGQVGDVYVIAQGGLGTVGLKSAEQDGGVVTFEFARPMCVGQSTFSFGLASNRPPHGIAAGMFGFGNPPFVAVGARAPSL
ncbi:MAG TPA: hypothetical protein VH249_23715 [Xanthobacteraceae bacterium]|jgi:hypothetical protein|nr:hypothetical protein [Xanthobacteraceae bacterium]